jgi:hypothetical protein
MEILVPSGVGYLNISIGMVCPLAVALRGLMLVAVFRREALRTNVLEALQDARDRARSVLGAP